LLVDLAKWFPK